MKKRLDPAECTLVISLIVLVVIAGTTLLGGRLAAILDAIKEAI